MDVTCGGFTVGLTVFEVEQCASDSSLCLLRLFRGPSFMGDANLFPIKQIKICNAVCYCTDFAITVCIFCEQ